MVARASRVPERRAWIPVAAAAILIGVACVVVWRGALPYFFAQDDFEGLARARGLLPRLAGPWRLISNELYFDVMAALAGLDAVRYHAASLAIHIIDSVLLVFLLRRHVGTPAAALGAMFFAVHPALFTAIYWIAATGALLGLGLALAALIAAGSRGAVRWVAPPLFALSLLCKETTVLLPVIAAALGPGSWRGARRDPVFWALAATAVLYGAGFALADRARLGGTTGTGAAYHWTPGPHLVTNALSYLGWAVNFVVFGVRGVADAVDPQVFPWAIAALVLWGIGFASPGLRRRGWGIGGLTFAVLILPVLPLANHTYHYYLYGPLLGVAWCAAAVFDRAIESAFAGPRTRAPVGGAVAVAACLLLAVNGAVLVHRIETYPFERSLRADPTVDRALIAGNVARSLAREPLPAGVTLRFWSPTLVQESPAAEGYGERNLRSALLDGLGVRVLFPAVHRVEFVRRFTPDADSVRYAVYLADGSLGVAAPALLDSLIRAHGPTAP